MQNLGPRALKALANCRHKLPKPQVKCRRTRDLFCHPSLAWLEKLYSTLVSTYWSAEQQGQARLYLQQVGCACSSECELEWYHWRPVTLAAQGCVCGQAMKSWTPAIVYPNCPRRQQIMTSMTSATAADKASQFQRAFIQSSLDRTHEVTTGAPGAALQRHIYMHRHAVTAVKTLVATGECDCDREVYTKQCLYRVFASSASSPQMPP